MGDSGQTRKLTIENQWQTEGGISPVGPSLPNKPPSPNDVVRVSVVDTGLAYLLSDLTIRLRKDVTPVLVRPDRPPPTRPKDVPPLPRAIDTAQRTSSPT